MKRPTEGVGRGGGGGSGVIFLYTHMFGLFLFRFIISNLVFVLFFRMVNIFEGIFIFRVC